jgi:hypothetical protein
LLFEAFRGLKTPVFERLSGDLWFCVVWFFVRKRSLEEMALVPALFKA